MSGIQKHLIKNELCKDNYSEADMLTVKKWAKDRKNAKRNEKRKNDRNSELKLDTVKTDLLTENECKFCHKKTMSGIQKHISQSKLCQIAYSEADLQTLKKLAKDRKNAKKKEK